MIFSYDLTVASMMNGGQPVYGRAARALANDTTLLRPVKFLYYAQLQPREETADDGLPIIFDDEERYHAGLANGDPAKLLLMFTAYAGVIKRIKAMAPSCPISVYGILPDAYSAMAEFGPAWIPARQLLSDLMDFVTVDLGSGSNPAAAFDTMLASLASLRTDFRGLPVLVKISPEFCSDDELARRLKAAANSPHVDQVCIWTECDATWDAPSPTLTGQYAQIAKQAARDFPAKRAAAAAPAAIAADPSLLSDTAVVQRLNDTIVELNQRQAQLGVIATFWKNAESAASALMKK